MAVSLWPSLAMTEAVSLLPSTYGPRGAVLQASIAPEKGKRTAPSLFIGRAETGFFGDRPAHDPAFSTTMLTRTGAADVLVIRALIEEAESRRDGYDAVQHGARIKPGKRPTQMTVAEIYHWIDRTPGQPHAIGRYQFIPATLKRVMHLLEIDPALRFSPQLQDRLADVLLAEAGLARLRAGQISRHAFMNNLAKIWAGLPNSSGKSHYAGYAGNKASISWARFDAALARVFPS
jgi:muramidase (phage lysozyme)